MIRSPIVIYLDKELTKKVRTVQQRLFELTSSWACLDLWEPHITVGSGVIVSDENEIEYCEGLSRIAKSFKPFEIQIKNYEFIDNWSGAKLTGYSRYAIYLDVVVANELQKLAQAIKEKIIKGREIYYEQPWPYSPHLTVAFKDLTKEGFLKAKTLLEQETFNDTTIVDHISIIKEDTTGKFNEFKRFNFSRSRPLPDRSMVEG